jgi:membrane protein
MGDGTGQGTMARQGMADHDIGKGAHSPFQVPPSGWLAVLKRSWKAVGDNNIGIIAAGIAFYMFAAIVPTLGAVVLSYGLFADAETVRANVEAVFASLPRDAASIITAQLLTVVESAKGKQGIGLVVALALAWYGATKGSSAIITGLNVAYDTPERRGFVRLNLLQFAVVAGGVLLIFVAMGTTMLLAFLNGLIPDAPGVVLAAVRLGGYVALALIVVTAAAILFRYGPDHRQPRWIWLSPGSVGATLLWLAGTAAFGFYVSHFGNYGATYGSLSAVIVTLTWLWLSAYVFLLGAELNAELERQVAGDVPFSPLPSEDAASEPVGLASLRKGRPLGVIVIAVMALAVWRTRSKA